MKTVIKLFLFIIFINISALADIGDGKGPFGGENEENTNSNFFNSDNNSFGSSSFGQEIAPPPLGDEPPFPEVTVPLDNNVFLLIIACVGVGVYIISRKNKLIVGVK